MTHVAGARRRRLGTAGRLALMQALLLATVLGLAVLGLVRAFDAQSRASTDRTLVAETQAFARAAAARPPGTTLGPFAEGYLRTRVLPDGDYLLVTMTGDRLLGSAGSQALYADPAVAAWSSRPPTHGVRQELRVGQTSYALVATPLQSAGRTVGAVVAAADLSRSHADRHRVLGLAVGEALVALVAGVAGSYLLLRSLLRPIGRITLGRRGSGTRRPRPSARRPGQGRRGRAAGRDLRRDGRPGGGGDDHPAPAARRRVPPAADAADRGPRPPRGARADGRR